MSGIEATTQYIPDRKQRLTDQEARNNSVLYTNFNRKVCKLIRERQEGEAADRPPCEIEICVRNDGMFIHLEGSCGEGCPHPDYVVDTVEGYRPQSTTHSCHDGMKD